jgi:hypothetical protein
VWQAKLAALTTGVAFIAVGVGLIRFGGRLTVAFNKVYARQPGRFQYPSWWHRLIGGFFCALRLLGAALALAGRQAVAGRRWLTERMQS